MPAAGAARLQLSTGGSWCWDPLPPQREAPLPDWLRQLTAAPRQGLPLEHLALPEWERRLLLARSCTAAGQAGWSRWRRCSPPPAQPSNTIRGAKHTVQDTAHEAAEGVRGTIRCARKTLVKQVEVKRCM